MDAPPRIDRALRRFNSVMQASQILNWPSFAFQFIVLFLQPRFEQGSAAWLNARWYFLNASIGGVPLGIYPKGWKTISGLFFEKMLPPGAVQDTFNVHMKRGHDNEDVALYVYEQKTGRFVLDFGMLLHHHLYDVMPAEWTAQQWFDLVLKQQTCPAWFDKEFWNTHIAPYNWYAGSPDGVTLCGRLIEIKCPKTLYRGGIPPYYNIQVQINMEVMNLEVCDFVQYDVATGELLIFEVPRDRSLFGEWEARSYIFWQQVIEARKTNVVPDEYKQVASSSGRKRNFETNDVQINDVDFNM
jgi:hypothetical protein